MRFRKKRSRSRRGGFFAKRSRRSGGGGSGGKLIQVDAMIYGALREKASNALAPLTSKIPLGAVADEIGMGLLSWMIAKKTSGLIHDVAVKGLVIENARLGEAIANEGFGLISGSSGSASGGFVYG